MVRESNENWTDDMPASHLAQFHALRDEINKRAEFEHQLIALTLAAAGTLAAVGLAADGSSLALLVYPLLTTFIAVSWLFNNFRIQQMGYYIRKRLEPLSSGLQWERFLNTEEAIEVRPGNKGLWGKWLSPETVPLGIFCASPLVFLILALPELLYCWPARQSGCGNSAVAYWTAAILFIVDFSLIILTAFLVHRFTVRPSRREQSAGDAPAKEQTAR